MHTSHYDIIITGGGAAARIFLYFLSKEKDFGRRRILVLEKENRIHEKTWCFWHAGEHPFQQLICKKWENLSFAGKTFTKTESIAPYAYCCIRGKDFNDYFNHVFFAKHTHIEISSQEVVKTYKQPHGWCVKTTSASYTCHDLISNLNLPTGEHQLFQHFHGWFIEMQSPMFDENNALLMDFSFCNENEFCFFYLLPFSKTKALVECTIYSTTIKDADAYKKHLEEYITRRLGKDYTVTETEYGAIPLIEKISFNHNEASPIRIGQSAGMIKPSTGYAFQRMVEDARLLAASYSFNKRRRNRSRRFRFYDRLLLSIIREEPGKAVSIFHALFAKRRISAILTFLDENTTLLDEIKIFLTLPWWPFIKRIPKAI